jgi:hypothetical protein
MQVGVMWESKPRVHGLGLLPAEADQGICTSMTPSALMLT